METRIGLILVEKSEYLSYYYIFQQSISQQIYYNRFSKMDVTLIRNGYNLQRRKMYGIENPRHNLRSSVQITWQQSLENHPNQIQKQKQKTSQIIKQNYSKIIDRKIEDELKMNKSSFRVMMAPQPNNMRTMSPGNRRSNSNGYYDSLNKQVDHYEQKNLGAYDSPIKNHKASQSLSKSVFGYEIDRTAFQKQSYLSKILNDRLQPFLHKEPKTARGDNSLPKHQSFTINHPISLQY